MSSDAAVRLQNLLLHPTLPPTTPLTETPAAMPSHNIVPEKVFGRRYLGVGYGAVRMMKPPRSGRIVGRVVGWTVFALAAAIAGLAALEGFSQR